jgi:hypothetical protein
MIAKSVDGTYYQNPRWLFDNIFIDWNDLSCCLNYRGKVTWRTAVKVLRPNGFRAVLDKGNLPLFTEGKFIVKVGGEPRLVDCSIFNIRFTGPIPVPHVFNLHFRERPCLDTEEQVVDFTRLRRGSSRPFLES